MKKLIAVVAGALLALILAVPAMAHPAVPAQSVCVINANAATGGHTAYGNVDGVAAHVLYVKSPHYCAGG